MDDRKSRSSLIDSSFGSACSVAAGLGIGSEEGVPDVSEDSSRVTWSLLLSWEESQISLLPVVDDFCSFRILTIIESYSA